MTETAITYHEAGRVIRTHPILDPNHTAEQFCVRCRQMLRQHCFPGYPEGAVIAIGPNWSAVYLGPEQPNCEVQS